MRVVIFAQDDSAVVCLGPLAAQNCKVLAVGEADEGNSVAVFARRCLSSGFSFVSTQEPAAVSGVVDAFAPELMLFVPGGHATQVPQAFQERSKSESGRPPRRCSFRIAGARLPGAPAWPEFAPIWLGLPSSRVELVELAPDVAPKVLAYVDVPVGAQDTAVSLRLKHAEVQASLLHALLEGSSFPESEGVQLDMASAEASKKEVEVPTSISLEWDEQTANRFIRAHLFPPRDPAKVVNPGDGEVYLVESLEQYQEFRKRLLQDGARGSANVEGSYAADTHWYSNVGGSIIKLSDSDIHMPTKASEKKRKAVIPGAALGARKKLRMNEPLIGPNAEQYCSSALESSWIGVEGPYVKQFERQLAQMCGCSAACAVQSGTAALYGAMKALGVSDRTHHVLVPSFTCAACADAVVHAGGRPIPIDSELDSWGVSVEAVRQRLDADKNIVGVVVAPCYGVPMRDFYEIYQLCKERGLWLCEDACESYGALQGIPSTGSEPAQVPVGSLATLCVISVRSEKMIGVGEGGAILGNDTPLVARAKWWCSRAPSRGVGLWRVYEHDAVGQNFRMPEMLAAVGCAAAEMLPVMIERKRAIHVWYEAGFAARPELHGLQLQKCGAADKPVWWITAALLPDNLSGESVGMQLMKDCPDIEIRPGFFPLHAMNIFKSAWCKACPASDRLYRGLVCLPSSNQLTRADVERVCGALADALRVVKGSAVEEAA